MQKAVGFVRIKPIQCEKSAESRSNDDELFDPLLAVKVLDTDSVPGPHITTHTYCAHDRRSGTERCCDLSLRPSVRLSVCLSHAQRSQLILGAEK